MNSSTDHGMSPDAYRIFYAPTSSGHSTAPCDAVMEVNPQPARFKRFDQVARVSGGPFRTGFVTGAGPNIGKRRWLNPQWLWVSWDDSRSKGPARVPVADVKLIKKGKR